jgi:proteasome accessory factor C
LKQGRRVHLTYVVPARDERTERDVEPLRLLVAEGRPYLEAWCLRAEDVRLFRVDRVEDARMLDEPVQLRKLEPRDLSAGLFQPAEDAAVAVLDLDGPARWITEQYAIDEAVEQPDGTVRVRLRVADLAWLRRLVLRQGGAARVVSPPELAEQVRRAAGDALKAYR